MRFKTGTPELKMSLRVTIAALLFPLVSSGALHLGAQERGCNCDDERGNKAQELTEYIRGHYTKSEYMVPMRDATRLFVSVYAPKDASQKYPIWMMRTPYTVSPYGPDNYRRSLGPSEAFARSGYIFAYCDVRGKGKSEGEFEDVRPFIPDKTGTQFDEASDTYDTIEFLLKTIPGHNGRVGISGTSYPGFYSTMALLSRHPALKAASPQAPVTEWFIGDDWRHNGVLFLAHAFGFYSSFGRPRAGEFQVPGPRFDYGTPDGYDFFLNTVGPLRNVDEKIFHGKIAGWEDVLTHDVYTDYWKSRNPSQYLTNIKAAVMTVGGLFDAEDVYGPWQVYESIEKLNPGITNFIVEGPWSHGQWNEDAGEFLGDIHWGQETAKFFREDIEFPFFEYFLKDKGEKDFPEAYIFETGRDEWHRLDAWPPRDAVKKALYFHAGGKLSYEPPAATGSNDFDEYVSDPSKPVPFFNQVTTRMVYEYMDGDQRFASSRTDVLVYQTEPLEQDLNVVGPLDALLFVSTDGTDADFDVKLIDVYPGDFPDPQPNPTNVRMGGYQQLVRGEPFRGRFRKGFDKPTPFEPGKPDKVEFVMPGIYHTFRRGHRVMIQVQSTWFPLTDRNPQKFMKISDARAADFQKATERVYRSPAMPSSLTVNVLE
jgi:putative CocE/NonD family hydrolase